LHLSFPASNWLMQSLRAIVGTQSLPGQTRVANFAKCRSVRSQFVGENSRWNEGLTSKQFPERPQRRSFVALGLDHDLKKALSRSWVLLVNRAGALNPHVYISMH
jgi:hypothetical protein